MSAYYNEMDPFAGQWLANLRAAGHVSPGRIDTRSITEVQPDEFQAVNRAHFFAGIGGWDHALRLAGWPDDAPVWTGSCPCQPFSGAGKGKGLDDERHLWPVWFELIKANRPPVIFGEQVAGKGGRAWWDVVSADLEGADYACRAVNLSAHSVAAPHIRQRLYWVAYANNAHRGPDGTRGHNGHRQDAGRAQATGHDAERGDAGRMANATSGHSQQPAGHGSGPGEAQGGRASGGHTGRGTPRGVEHSDGGATGQHRGELQGHEGQHEVGQAHGGDAPQHPSGDGGLGDANDERPQGRCRRRDSADQRPSWPSGMVESQGASSLAGQWAEPDWLYCRDGKWRPTSASIQPLAYGVPNRVGMLRGAGNAIVPQVAALFIEAVMETLNMETT